MSASSFKAFRVAISTIMVCAALLSGASKPVCGEEPVGVVRTFAVEVAGLSSAPDFLSDQSLGVVVAPADPQSSPAFLRFTAVNSDERFDSTVWEHRHVMHITTEGAAIPGAVFWLLTPDTPAPPPQGAHTFTGPDSPFILSQELIYIKQCTSTTCPFDYTGTVTVGTATDNDSLLVVVTAVFSD
ncbi:MAG TPA: hypothetical protein VMP01_23755 [Pirellulaceae bacterium]|nr:hypothetical protein [Pirellulaceae bacterium]